MVKPRADEPDRLLVRYPLVGPPAALAFEYRVGDRLRGLGIETVEYWIDRLILDGVPKEQKAAAHRAVVETIEEENARRVLERRR